VKKFQCLAALAAVVSLGYLFSLATAQNAVPARPKAPATSVALLDVPKIFKTHTRMKLQLEELKRDMQTADAKFKQEREEIRRMYDEGLRQFQKGTDQYSQMEEQLAGREAKMQVDMNRDKNSFLQRKASIFQGVYQEIWQATDFYCRQNGIDMVMLFANDQYDPQYPESVMNYVLRPVVWYDPGLDITNDILRDVNRPAATPNHAGADQGTQPASPFKR
jgi:Skp family chaperone for outer membrane proteins